jgi:hypothetical protein
MEPKRARMPTPRPTSVGAIESESPPAGASAVAKGSRARNTICELTRGAPFALITDEMPVYIYLVSANQSIFTPGGSRLPSQHGGNPRFPR